MSMDSSLGASHAMRRVFIATAAAMLLVLLNGCESEKKPLSANLKKTIAAQYTAAWNSQDPASVAEFFAEDGTLFVNGAPSNGREAITELVGGFMTAFPDMKLSMDALEINPDQVIFHWTFVGTNTGPGGTGNAVRFSGYEEWTLGKGGLITTSLGHFDNQDYQDQLQQGLDPDKP